ncbi:hypothetical protein JL721_9909 [Aureococcus anophagefferens]|nr:hypothetical protein JL721_9909 [Aureococcus anophagefferens]
MSVTILHAGRRQKISLSSNHVPVHKIVAEAVAKFGLSDGASYGLRTTRGRRADVDECAAWAHTGLSNNCELELVRKAGGGGAGGPVRVAVAVSHRGSAPRSATFAVDSSSTLAAVVARSADEGAAPPDALRRSPVVRALRDNGGAHGHDAPADASLDAAADALGDALAAVGAVGGAAGAARRAARALRRTASSRTEIPKHRAIRRGNAAFAQRIEAVGGERVLAALGFHAEDRGGELWLVLCDDGARDLAALKRAKAALAALCAAPAPVAAPAFDPFSTHRVDMRSGAAKKATVPSETAVASELGDQARALEGAAVAPERMLTLQSAAAQDAAAAKARADAHFGSADDGAGRGDSNLAMRDVAALEKLRVYDVAAIKVQFPDRTVMGARFHPREPVAAVYAAVRGVLALGAPDFALFVSPPKRDLPQAGGTLADLGLVPAAKVFVSWASPATGPFLSHASLALLDADVAERVPGAPVEEAAAEPAAAAKPSQSRPDETRMKT